MSVPSIDSFFKSKVQVQLKSGQRFEGKLRQVNDKEQQIVLIDVVDLGNERNHNLVPHDKIIAEKVFEAKGLTEIFFSQRHFAQPKKYKMDSLYDNTTDAPSFHKEPKKYQKYQEKNEKYQNKYESKPQKYQEKKETQNRDYR